MKIQVTYIESKTIDNQANFFNWDSDMSYYVKENYKDTNKIISENISHITTTIDNVQFIERTVTRIFESPESLLEFNLDQRISEHRKLKNTYNLNNKISTRTEKTFID
jgi:hypothetical protein